MATTYTENYHLGKQENHADKFRMDVITANMDIIDEQIKKNEDEITSAKGTYTTLSERLSSIESVQESHGTALAEIVDGGAKNMLNPLYLNAASITGVTITANGDGTYNLSGTPTGTAEYLQTPSNAVTNMLGLKPGKKYCISAGSSKVKIRVDYSTNGTSWDNGGGSGFVTNAQGFAEFDVSSNAVGIFIRFRSTTTDGSLDGETLSPMICTKAAWDISQQYVPHRPSYDELIARIEALEGGV